MATITYTIPDDKLARVIAAMAGLYPIPNDPFTQEPEFSEAQWAKEAVRRLIVRDVQRWEQRAAIDAAEATVVRDDTIVT